MVRTKPSPSKRSSQSKFLQIGGKQYSVRAKVLKSIKSLQRSVQHCIPRKPFSSLIREIVQETQLRQKDLRIQLLAMKALQEAAEMYLVGIFEDGNMCAAHAKRITVTPADVKLALCLRGDYSKHFH